MTFLAFMINLPFYFVFLLVNIETFLFNFYHSITTPIEMTWETILTFILLIFCAEFSFYVFLVSFKC